MARVPDPSPHPKQKEGTDLNVHQLEEQRRLSRNHSPRSPSALLGFGSRNDHKAAAAMRKVAVANTVVRSMTIPNPSPNPSPNPNPNPN